MILAAAERIVSLSSLSAIEVPPPQFVEFAAMGGFNAVGVRAAQTGQDRGFQLPAGSALLRDTKSALADNGMRVLDVEVVKLHPGSSRGDWSAVLEAGAELGADYLLVTVLDDDRGRAESNFAELAELSGDYGLRACLEPMIFSSVRDVTAAAAFVEAVAGRAGVLVDALHWARAGSEVSDITAVAEDLLPYCQLCDAVSAAASVDPNAAITEARTHRLAPGTGALPLVELLRALPASAAVSVEAPSARSVTDPGGWIAELGRATWTVLDELVHTNEKLYS
ncbi:sugar phosphate isomerase/epimerase family protein [Rhodococcus sp. 06-418-5]|uniref:sugar phosphate isomerase/epimerase family protein n=1 Tax=Rhodococcus sp. 06-418-5 TaxID=2022507 RepID=UPI00211AE4D8|nr:TIM barrel protein [Rhodococcus sp. 06-418-5]